MTKKTFRIPVEYSAESTPESVIMQARAVFERHALNWVASEHAARRLASDLVLCSRCFGQPVVTVFNHHQCVTCGVCYEPDPGSSDCIRAIGSTLARAAALWKELQEA
jgi:rubredoxin